MIRIFAILLGILLFPATVGAAELYFEPDADASSPGVVVRAAIRIADDINAFEGTVLYDPTFLRVISVNDGGGVVPLWIERPGVREPGAIAFAGIVPGGFQHNVTDRAALFEMRFAVLGTGTTDLTYADAKVLLHTADAAEDEVSIIPLTVMLSGPDVGAPADIEDSLSPESFRVHIERNAAVTDDATVAVFSTRDFQSGISGYEVRERILGITGRWRASESPAVLSWYWPFSIIEVRAIDHAGNDRVARAIPSSLSLLVIVLIGGGVYISWRRRVRT